MKLIFLALIISISLHLLTFKTFKVNEEEEITHNQSKTKNPSKSDIKYVVLKSVQKPQAKKAIEKKQTEKKIKKALEKVSKKIKKYKEVKKEEIVKTKKRIPIKKKEQTISKKPSEVKKVIPNYENLNPTDLQKNTLEKFLSKDNDSLEMLDELTKSYIKLYGEEYSSFTKVQKVYLKENLKTIGSITQKYLRYPTISVRTRQSGTNIIEFTLHPNGDITKPMITTSSGYEALDDNTIKTIQIAYKDYPRPTEPTKIKIYVIYKLY